MKNRKREKLPYLLILPAMIIILCTVIYPVILTFIYSLQSYKITKIYDRKFIGLKNYLAILKDENFYSVLINTGIVIGVILILGVILSFILALILNRENKLTNIFTAIAIIPWALPPVVNGLMWKFIFYPEFGLLNKILYFLNFTDKPILWLNTQYGSLIIFGVIVAWRAIPFCSVLLLANMKAIPEEIFEAAQVDGASTYEQIKSIMIPILFPTFLVVVTNLILIGLNVFDEIVALVGFRKLGETFMIYNYSQTFTFLNIGYGSAISYLITILCGVLGYVYIVIIKRRLR
jgi:multiple sugar transport system permease protein